MQTQLFSNLSFTPLFCTFLLSPPYICKLSFFQNSPSLHYFVHFVSDPRIYANSAIFKPLLHSTILYISFVSPVYMQTQLFSNLSYIPLFFTFHLSPPYICKLSYFQTSPSLHSFVHFVSHTRIYANPAIFKPLFHSTISYISFVTPVYMQTQLFSNLSFTPLFRTFRISPPYICKLSYFQTSPSLHYFVHFVCHPPFLCKLSYFQTSPSLHYFVHFVCHPRIYANSAIFKPLLHSTILYISFVTPVYMQTQLFSNLSFTPLFSTFCISPPYICKLSYFQTSPSLHYFVHFVSHPRIYANSAIFKPLLHSTISYILYLTPVYMQTQLFSNLSFTPLFCTFRLSPPYICKLSYFSNLSFTPLFRTFCISPPYICKLSYFQTSPSLHYFVHFLCLPRIYANSAIFKPLLHSTILYISFVSSVYMQTQLFSNLSFTPLFRTFCISPPYICKLSYFQTSPSLHYFVHIVSHTPGCIQTQPSLIFSFTPLFRTFCISPPYICKPSYFQTSLSLHYFVHFVCHPRLYANSAIFKPLLHSTISYISFVTPVYMQTQLFSNLSFTPLFRTFRLSPPFLCKLSYFQTSPSLHYFVHFVCLPRIYANSAIFKPLLHSTILYISFVTPVYMQTQLFSNLSFTPLFSTFCISPPYICKLSYFQTSPSLHYFVHFVSHPRIYANSAIFKPLLHSTISYILYLTPVYIQTQLFSNLSFTPLFCTFRLSPPYICKLSYFQTSPSLHYFVHFVCHPRIYANSAIFKPLLHSSILYISFVSSVYMQTQLFSNLSFTPLFRTFCISPPYICKLSYFQTSPSLHYFVHFICLLRIYANSAIFKPLLHSTISYILYLTPVYMQTQLFSNLSFTPLFRTYRITPLDVCKLSHLWSSPSLHYFVHFVYHPRIYANPAIFKPLFHSTISYISFVTPVYMQTQLFSNLSFTPLFRTFRLSPPYICKLRYFQTSPSLHYFVHFVCHPRFYANSAIFKPLLHSTILYISFVSPVYMQTQLFSNLSFTPLFCTFRLSPPYICKLSYFQTSPSLHYLVHFVSHPRIYANSAIFKPLLHSTISYILYLTPVYMQSLLFSNLSFTPLFRTFCISPPYISKLSYFQTSPSLHYFVHFVCLPRIYPNSAIFKPLLHSTISYISFVTPVYMQTQLFSNLSFTPVFCTFHLSPPYICKLSSFQTSPSLHYFVHIVSHPWMYANSAIFDLLLHSTISYILYITPVYMQTQLFSNLSFTPLFRTFCISPPYICKLSYFQTSPSLHYFVHFICLLRIYANSAIFKPLLHSTISYILYLTPVYMQTQLFSNLSFTPLFRTFRMSHPVYMQTQLFSNLSFTPLFRTFRLSPPYICKLSYFQTSPSLHYFVHFVCHPRIYANSAIFKPLLHSTISYILYLTPVYMQTQLFSNLSFTPLFRTFRLSPPYICKLSYFQTSPSLHYFVHFVCLPLVEWRRGIYANSAIFKPLLHSTILYISFVSPVYMQTQLFSNLSFTPLLSYICICHPRILCKLSYF